MFKVINFMVNSLLSYNKSDRQDLMVPAQDPMVDALFI